MSDQPPYLGYELTGPRTVRSLLEGRGVECVIFEDDAVGKLFESRAEVLSPERDSVVLGKLSGDGRELFFAEFALQIHDGMVSHLSFLFDHMPLLEDLQACADDMEGIVLKTLKKVHDEGGGLS